MVRRWRRWLLPRGTVLRVEPDRSHLPLPAPFGVAGMGAADDVDFDGGDRDLVHPMRSFLDRF
jgi:hypothetical protein